MSAAQQYLITPAGAWVAAKGNQQGVQAISPMRELVQPSVLTCPIGASSAPTVLPTGVDAVSLVNSGNFTASLLIGNNTVTATATSHQLLAGERIDVLIGAGTHIAGWGIGGATTVGISGLN